MSSKNGILEKVEGPRIEFFVVIVNESNDFGLGPVVVKEESRATY